MSTPFPNTRWSMVADAGSADRTEAKKALAELCKAYWSPIYAFARRSGRSPEDAEDLTQGFFASLLRRELLQKADATRGRLRSYLLKSFRNFARDEWKKAHAAKRGDGEQAIDLAGAEKFYRRDSSADRTPEQVYERRWALTLLQRSADRLRENYTSKGKGDLFASLKPFLEWNSDAAESAGAVSSRLGMTENALHQAVSRMRRKYRAFLEEEIADTLIPGERIEDELAAFVRALS